MIRKDKIRMADGTTKTHVRVVKSYRPGPGQNPKQATLKSFGYLEDAQDPERLMEEVALFDREQRTRPRKKTHMITIPADMKNNDEANRRLNYGYRFLSSVYDALGIRSFFDRVPFRGDYSLSDVFEFLVLERILNPDSKRGTFREIRSFYNKTYDFSLPDIYRALDKFAEVSLGLQRDLNTKVKQMIGRDASYAFYDVTNYYFDTDFAGPEGTYQQKGVSKEHRISPIVQLGLFIDSNHLPIAMTVYPGNTSDTLTLRPAMDEVKENYHLGRIIVVCDKGLNSKANIEHILSQGDGYVVSQTLRGSAGKRYHDVLFDPEGYVGNDTFKYKLFIEEYDEKIGKSKTVRRKRKVLIRWSREEEAFAQRKRQEKIRRANKRLKNNAYTISHKADEYIKTTNIVIKTGEVSDGMVNALDDQKILDEARFDGYFCIITSELDYDHKKILEVYGQLWRIEESFRITKSDLETRPMFVRTDKHIEGHLLVCYVALLVIRLLQYHLGYNEISVNRIKRVLGRLTCRVPSPETVLFDEVGGLLAFKETVDRKGNIVETLAYDETRDLLREDHRTIQKAFGVEMDVVATTRDAFNRYLKSIRFKPRKQK
jgi:transposase